MKKSPFYSKEVLKHFRNPKNFGEMKNPDGVGKVGNLICGDIIWLYIKIKEKAGKKKIIEAKFQTLGCAVAIAVSSIITTLVKGKTLEEALNLKKESILKITGDLPANKIHCSILADDALHEAIYDYLKKNKLPIPQRLGAKHEMIQKTLKRIEKRYKKKNENQK